MSHETASILTALTARPAEWAAVLADQAESVRGATRAQLLRLAGLLAEGPGADLASLLPLVGVPVHPDRQAAELERLAGRAIATDPVAAAGELNSWLRAVDVEGLDGGGRNVAVLRPLAVTIARLALRGAVEHVDPVLVGELTGAQVDMDERGALRGTYSLVLDRLVRVGAVPWALRLVEEAVTPYARYDDLLLDALLRHGRYDEAAALLEDLLARSAPEPLLHPVWARVNGDHEGLLRHRVAESPPVDLPVEVLGLLGEVARAAPESPARGQVLAQLALLAVRSTVDSSGGIVATRTLHDETTGRLPGPADELVTEAAAAVERGPATEWDVVVSAFTLLDLAAAVGADDPDRGRSLVEEARALRDRDDLVPAHRRFVVTARLAHVLGQLAAPQELGEEDRTDVESWAAAYALGRLVAGDRDPDHALAAAEQRWADRARAMEVLARAGAWEVAFQVAASGWERYPWVARLGWLAGLCARLDRPEALPRVVAAVDMLPIADDERLRARELVLEGLLADETWVW